MTIVLSTKIDLCFPSFGNFLPVDHGFALYSAISRVLPVIHKDQNVGVKLVSGRYVGGGLLDISPASELVLRIPVDNIGQYLKLAGKKLEVLGHIIIVGVPFIRPLLPAIALYSPLVTTKNGHDLIRFEKEIKRQIAKLNIKGNFNIGRRRTFQVHGKQIVGFELFLTNLNASESIRLQEHGLGGRRKFGCGLFYKWSKSSVDSYEKLSKTTSEIP